MYIYMHIPTYIYPCMWCELPIGDRSEFICDSAADALRLIQSNSIQIHHL